MPRGVYDLSVAQLEKILEQRRGRIAVLERQRLKVARQLEALDSKIAAEGGRTGGRVKRARNSASLADTITDVLKKAGSAMKVADIVSAVQDAGYRSTSDNFRGIVNQVLIKDKRFSKGPMRGTYATKR